jgi:hypothetical protein
MAAFNKFNVFTTDLTNGKHDFSSATFKVMLTNTAPVATNAVKADLTDISAGNGYTAGGTATTISKSNASGTETVKGTNVVFTASGGSIGPFRYAALYNDTQATPAKPLVCWWDYGSAVTLASGETFTVDTNGDSTDTIFTLG